MKNQLFKFSLIVAIVFTFSSCGPSAVVVKNRPEPPVVVRPVAPGPSHVWVDGEWIVRNGRYVYMPGYWVMPKHRAGVWVPGHWQARRGGWYWVGGHWR